MKTMIFAAAALSLGMNVAFANEDGPNPRTSLTQIPGVIAQAPVMNVPSIDTTQRTDSAGGSWLFPPIGKYLDQHAGG